MGLVAQSLGILRSLRMYYGDAAQTDRMVRFYSQFIRPGDLCFDVGAHVGSRVRPWLRLGASVVAIEPLPSCVRLLRGLYGRSNRVRLVQAALGPAVGQQQILICEREPTVSTLSGEWIDRVRRERQNFANVRWSRSVVVPVVTLDALIDRYGRPAFCKIDTEGYDFEVLRGLSRPLPTLSFEYVPPALDIVERCLERLGELGDYEYNWSPGECMRLDRPDWVGAAEIAAHLRPLPPDANPGDVYARLRAGPAAA